MIIFSCDQCSGSGWIPLCFSSAFGSCHLFIPCTRDSHSGISLHLWSSREAVLTLSTFSFTLSHAILLLLVFVFSWSCWPCMLGLPLLLTNIIYWSNRIQWDRVTSSVYPPSPPLKKQPARPQWSLPIFSRVAISLSPMLLSFWMVLTCSWHRQILPQSPNVWLCM